MLVPLEDDPRFAAARAHFDAGDWLEASDLFEELYFEAVRDEVPLVRLLLQISTGMHHIARGQRRAAVERLEEGRSEEHTSELQSPCNLVCRLLLEKKKRNTNN